MLIVLPFDRHASLARLLNCGCQTVALHHIQKLLLLFWKQIQKRLNSMKPFIVGVKSKCFSSQHKNTSGCGQAKAGKKAEVETVHNLIWRKES